MPAVDVRPLQINVAVVTMVELTIVVDGEDAGVVVGSTVVVDKSVAAQWRP